MSGLDAESLAARHHDLEVEIVESVGSESVLRLPGASARALLSRLRDEAEGGPLWLIDLAAIDRGSGSHRFEIVYRLRSAEGGLRVHALVAEDAESGVPVIDSVAALWPAADWLEREAFDLFGIRFRGHPDLRRILLEETFDGAPLRKDHVPRLDRSLPAAETS
jgi:NADH:ubiquinone oxidoreductase subunit C